MSPLASALGLAFSIVIANQIVMRVERLWRRPVVFWSLQVLNAVLAAAILAFGLPGFEHSGVARFSLGGVFVFRFVWNLHERRSALWEERRQALFEEHERVLALIRDGESADDE